jgi:hypothetical protein
MSKLITIDLSDIDKTLKIFILWCWIYNIIHNITIYKNYIKLRDNLI